MEKQKLHQPGYVLLSQYACTKSSVCPLPCDSIVLFPCPFISWHLHGDCQRGRQSMSMSVVMLLCSGNVPKKWTGTPHPMLQLDNLFPLLTDLLICDLLAHWWPRYERRVSCLGLWVLPSWMSSGCYMYAHFTSTNLVLQSHPCERTITLRRVSIKWRKTLYFPLFIFLCRDHLQQQKGLGCKE